MPNTVAITALAIANEENEVAHTLKANGYTLALHPHMVMPNRDELRALLQDAVGVIAGSEPYTREVMEEAKHLRIISRNGVGYDAIDVAAATELGIVVAYTPDAMVDAVADLALGLMLGLARRIVELDSRMKQGEWHRAIAADVSGRTLGLVGTGRIGLATARRAKAFKMRLVGFDPYPNPLFVEELGADYTSLEELFEVADYVSLHVPTTASSRGLVNRDLLARMKPSAFLINTARGTIVDEEALLEALNEGRLAGAGLDVFSSEPPIPGSAGDLLARHPKVIALPHVAAYTPTAVARMGRGACQNILSVLNGLGEAQIVNPEVFERGLRQTD